jgi:hypothetical protein
VKRARELIYTAERQVSRDVGLAGLRLKPGSSHYTALNICQKKDLNIKTYNSLFVISFFSFKE